MHIQPDFLEIYKTCLDTCNRYIAKGLLLQSSVICLSERTDMREEYCINSKYLHRGFYCPSPDMEHIVANMRRGTIAKRITSSSRITNRYAFDTDGKLRVVETFYPNGSSQNEYIFYEGSTAFGITFCCNDIERITEICVAEYKAQQIQSCLWGFCTYDKATSTYHFFNIRYERYSYEHEGYLDTELFDMILSPTLDLDKYCNYYKFRFNLTDAGKLIPKSRVAITHQLIKL